MHLKYHWFQPERIINGKVTALKQINLFRYLLCIFRSLGIVSIKCWLASHIAYFKSKTSNAGFDSHICHSRIPSSKCTGVDQLLSFILERRWRLRTAKNHKPLPYCFFLKSDWLMYMSTYD